MVMCSVVGCSNRTGRKPAHQIKKELKTRISFHRYPTDPGLHQAWIDVIRRKDWLPNKTSSVCSEHFAKDCFDVSPFYSKLSKTAVPTIFPMQYYSTPPLNPSLEQLSTSRDLSPIPEQSTDAKIFEESSSRAPVPIPKAIKDSVTKTTTFSSDRRKIHPFSPSRATLIRNYKFKVSEYKKKIQSLQQKTIRQGRRIAKLQTGLKKMKSKKLISEEIEKVLYIFLDQIKKY